MLKGLTTAALAATLLAGSAFSALADGHVEFKLRATANSNENDEDYDGLVVFKNYVEQASNGKIEVEMFIGTQLCSNGAECLQGVADGSVDIYISTSGGASGIFPFVQVLDLPYLMADDRVAEAALSGGTEFMTKMKDMTLEASGGMIRLMTVGNTGGWRNFANTKRRVAAPADMEGLKIRTVVADLPQELVKALGAISVCIKATKISAGTDRVIARRVTNSIRYSNPSFTHVKPIPAKRKTGATISSTVRARFTDCFLKFMVDLMDKRACDGLTRSLRGYNCYA